MTVDDDATTLFLRASGGFEPYDYQLALLGRATPPSVIEVPTGSGKTLAALVPWLADASAPRRLVYALPMRSLVEQTEAVIRAALSRLENDTPVHVLMGGVDATDWRREPERRAVIVGTIDMLLSRALNRGYGESPFAWPVSFGLLNNDCRWIFDEIQLMGPARTTSAQLQGLRAKMGTALRCQTVWMSATVDHEALKTIDHPIDADTVRLSDADRVGPLGVRLNAAKLVERVDLTAASGSRVYRSIAEALAARHRPGTRSIAVVNRVETAQGVYEAMLATVRGRDRAPAVVLLHSRFRPPERSDRMLAALAQPGPTGTIVVATQVVEAGVDFSSAVLATETAPFSSIVQRLGRCNRAGEYDAAQVLWLDRGALDAKAAAPYHPDDLEAAREALFVLVGESASPATLEKLSVAERREITAVLRRRDLADLFDTSPDLSGSGVDVAPYVREDDERTVSVFFRNLEGLTATEIAEQAAPARDELVAIPIAVADKLAGRVFDIVDDGWRLRRRGERLRPGDSVMLDALAGGYDAERGWTGVARHTPPPLPPSAQRPQAFGSNPETYTRAWTTLLRHLDDAMRVCAALVGELGLERGWARALVRAAALHDVGKAHPSFQEMLLGSAPEEARAELARETWAKSAFAGGRHVRRHFRHELVSALMLRAPVGDEAVPESDLVRYLVAAHHGRVRLSIRPAPGEEPPHGAHLGVRFALGVAEGDPIPIVGSPVGQTAAMTLDLAEMELGGAGGRAWSDLACTLRDDLGPLVLAYLEALLRIADWRASG